MAGGGDQSARRRRRRGRAGRVAVTMGTSGVVFAPTESPLIEPEGRLHAFCHALPNRWHLMGVMLSAAGSLQWYRDTLAPDMSFDALVKEAEEAPAGSEGLLFLPYLSGERTPYPDPLARGSWIGLTVRHKRAHLTRAVLEGVSFSLKDCFGLLEAVGLGAVSEARISGGGARGRLWRRILAGALGVALVALEADEGAALGAALLAGIGAGVWPDADIGGERWCAPGRSRRARCGGRRALRASLWRVSRALSSPAPDVQRSIYRIERRARYFGCLSGILPQRMGS